MFLILKSPRTGSSMFGNVLDSHPEISCECEFLNHLKKSSLRDKVNYVYSYFSENKNGENSEPKHIIGGTINPFKYKLEPPNFYQLIYPDCSTETEFLLRKKQSEIKPQIQIILLLRKNFLKQAISLYLVKERKQWASSLDLIKNKETLNKEEFDLDKLQKLFIDVNNSSAKLTQFANSLTNDYHTVFYEDFLEDSRKVKVFNQVFTYVGASPMDDSFDFTAGFQKINSDDLRNVIANYQDLYKYSEFLPYLEN